MRMLGKEITPAGRCGAIRSSTHQTAVALPASLHAGGEILLYCSPGMIAKAQIAAGTRMLSEHGSDQTGTALLLVAFMHAKLGCSCVYVRAQSCW